MLQQRTSLTKLYCENLGGPNIDFQDLVVVLSLNGGGGQSTTYTCDGWKIPEHAAPAS